MTNGGGSSPPAGETEADKKSTFRQRRLSVAQDSNPDTRNRRLSVYGGMSEDDKVPSVVTSPITTCGCKTVGGLEPVPGGTSAKINQDRGLALWPYRGVEDDKIVRGSAGQRSAVQLAKQCVLRSNGRLERCHGT